MNAYDKNIALKNNLKNLGSLAVAFSGGIDSAFLLKTAYDVLGDNACAITVCSSVFSEREYNDAIEFAAKLGVRHIVLKADVFEVKGFSENPKDRCYFCKSYIFNTIIKTARENGFDFVADGSNVDDLGDYRPGMKAIKELNVMSPLMQVGMGKSDIRLLSKELGLPDWNKPSFACLASRFPYGQKITEEKLRMVEKAEQHLFDIGFKQVRVRNHGDIARIEVPSEDRNKFFNEKIMNEINDKFKEIGFAYTALDLKGYRTGSMNESIVK